MNIVKVDKTEQSIAEYCVLDTNFLARYIEFHMPQLIKSPQVLMVIDICIDFFNKYEVAPRTEFESLIKNQLDKGQIDEADVNWSILFEKGINYNTSINVDYFIDNILIYLKKEYDTTFRRSLKDIDDYTEYLAGYAPPEEKVVQSVNPFEDDDIIRQAAKVITKESLIKFPGALGKLVNKHFTRAGFVCFFGSAKKGKSWWLLKTLERALLQGRGAFYTSISDMLQDEVVTRIGHMNSNLPVHKEDLGFHRIPVVDCIHNQTNKCKIPCDMMVKAGEDGVLADYRYIEGYSVCKEHCNEFKGTTWYKEKELTETLSEATMLKAWHKLKRKTRNNKLEIFTGAAGDITPRSLEEWYQRHIKVKGWKPEVVIIDYVDLMYAEQHYANDRDRFNAVFMALNSWAKLRDILVVSATQTNADGYEAEIISELNFSGDRRKMDHITAGIGLNQSAEEKEKGYMRLNVFISRHGGFNKNVTVKVLQDLTLGKVYLSSYM